MKRYWLCLTGLVLSYSVYACSSEDEAGSADQTGTGGALTGTGGASSSQSNGGNATLTGGSGSVQTGGATNAGGAALNGGAAGAAGAPTLPSSDCGALCSGGSCTAQPACFEQAYGIGVGSQIPICIPPATLSQGIVACQNSRCANGEQGCGLTVELGTTAWTLTAAGNPPSTNVALSTVIMRMVGTIEVSSTQATLANLSILVPSDGVEVEATGTLAQKPGGSSQLGLAFENANVDYTGLSVSSDPATYTALANAMVQAAYPNITDALLSALNDRANALSCLKCRPDCSQQLACVSG